MNKKLKKVLTIGLIIGLAGVLGLSMVPAQPFTLASSNNQISIVTTVLPLMVKVVRPNVFLEQDAPVGKVSSWDQLIPGSKLVLGGIFTLEEGEYLEGGLLVLGGNVTLRQGSTVSGDVALFSGTLRAAGEVKGSIISVGGLVQLSETAVVAGDVNVLGGQLQGETLGDIQGEVNSNVGNSFTVGTPGGFRFQLPNLENRINPFWNMLWLVFQSFLWSALAILTLLFIAEPVRKVGAAVVSQPIVAGGLGLLTGVVAPFALLILVITIIGIPVAVLLVLALIVAWVFGIIAIGTETGERLSKLGRANWSKPVSAGLGTFLLTLIIHGIGKFVPCVGWLLPFVVGVVGLGAVLLTRFGTHEYPEVEEKSIMAQTLPDANPDQ